LLPIQSGNIPPYPLDMSKSLMVIVIHSGPDQQKGLDEGWYGLRARQESSTRCEMGYPP
jgi:hypothetical protein